MVKAKRSIRFRLGREARGFTESDLNAGYASLSLSDKDEFESATDAGAP